MGGTALKYNSSIEEYFDAKIAFSDEKFVYSDTFVVCGKTEIFPKMPKQ